MDVTRAQVLAYRAAAQGLHRDTDTVAKLAVLDIGVQQSSADGVRLAFDARLADTPPLDGVGPGKPLAYVWSFRAAPHVHRRRDLNKLAGALWPISEQDAAARLDSSASLRKADLSVLESFAVGIDALRASVTKPTGKGAASTAVTKLVPRAMTRECRACQARHVFELPFRMGLLPAGLELEPDTAPPVLQPRSRATRPDHTDTDALRALIVAYLTLLGPAGPAEVAGYLDARKADVVELWPDNLREVSVDGRQAWLPAGKVRALSRPRAPEFVRLLGAFDPWLQARDRDLIVPDRSRHKALWPVLGRPGVVLVDGEVAGTWRPKTAGKRLTLAVQPFAGFGKATWSAVETEAQRVAAVRGAPDVTVKRVE